MQPNILQIFLIWLIPISIELFIGWVLFRTASNSDFKGEKGD